MSTTKRFETVLLPLDGSELAEQALPVCAAVAQKSGATVHLVAVLEPFPPLAYATEFPAANQQIQDESRRRLEEYLRRAATVVRKTGVSHVRRSLLQGPVATSLAEYVTSERIDLLVMMTHGRGGLSRLWLGSVADRLLRTVSVPILLLRARTGPYPTAFHRVLVALDGEIEQEVVDVAVRFAALTPGTGMVLARVVEPPIPGLIPPAVEPVDLEADWSDRLKLEAENDLAGVATRLGPAVPVTTRVQVGRPVPDQLFRIAQATDADLIVMGTHGARGLERLLLGSVADKMIRQGELPLLIVPVRRGERRAAVASSLGSGSLATTAAS